MENETCACGRPLHYSDPDIQERIERIVEDRGQFIPITTPEGTWLVQRHYIALHGLRAAELPALGLFRKIHVAPTTEF